MGIKCIHMGTYRKWYGCVAGPHKFMYMYIQVCTLDLPEIHAAFSLGRFVTTMKVDHVARYCLSRECLAKWLRS